MVTLNLKLERQQRFPPIQLVNVTLIIAVLLVSLTRLLDLPYSECNSNFSDADVGTTLLQLLVVSPAVEPTSLASQQSYGLFDDIPDQRWELMRKRSHEEHTYVQKNPSTMPGIRHDNDNPIIDYLSNLEPDFNCPHENRVGGLGSNSVWTCNTHRLLDRKECLIYSFGSDGKYTWEDSLIDLLGSTHCEIHVFDPIDHERAGDDILQNTHYHKWDLKSSYHDMFNAYRNRNARRGAKLDSYTFQEILVKLGHQERTIDILKMNFDGRRLTEWTTYNDWLKADIRQVLVSNHGAPFSVGTEKIYLPLLGGDFFSAFTSRYYAMFSKEEKVGGFDFGYVKLHPDFWKSGGQDFTDLRQDFPPALSFSAPDPAFRIPRRFVLVNEKNVMISEDPVESFLNVRNTVRAYKKAWDVSEVNTWSVDSFTCLAILHTVKVELYSYYRAEMNPARRTAVCSVAAMYLSGGFYFDVDLEVGSAYAPVDDVGLVVARDGDSLSSQFMACEPQSSVMEMTLERMLDCYKRNQTHPDFELGPLLEESITALKATVRSEIVSLGDIGRNILTPWIPPTLPAGLFDNPVPLEMRGPPSPEYKIPRRLLFTYKSNILETKEPPLFYDNVLKTIKMYREAWGEPDAPVWFLDDDDCRAAIYSSAKPHLLTYFDREINGAYKADICRLAALYLTGGYYFDVDMEAVNPWIPSRNVTFATAVEPSRIRYFQSFLASEKNGRVIEEGLNEMVLFYEHQKLRTYALIGPDTLKWAFHSIPPSELGETVVLEEDSFNLADAEHQSRREAVGCCCNFEVKDPVTAVTIFYSRIVGNNWKCAAPNSSVGEASLEGRSKD